MIEPQQLMGIYPKRVQHMTQKTREHQQTGRTALQGSKLGLIREAQHLMGIRAQEVQFQDGGGRSSCQHIPHGIILWNGLGLACQPDVPPVSQLRHLQPKPAQQPTLAQTTPSGS